MTQLNHRKLQGFLSRSLRRCKWIQGGRKYQTRCWLLGGGEERDGEKKIKEGMQAGNNVSAVTGSCHR